MVDRSLDGNRRVCVSRSGLVLALLLGLLCAPAPSAAEGDEVSAVKAPSARPAGGESDPGIQIPLRLELTAKADLTPASVKYAIFPQGKRCAFTYGGPKDPKTIGFLSKMGFRTTMYLGGGTSADYIKALEDAGAEIGAGSFWGAKGGYASLIEGNSVQECFDAIVTTRMVLKSNSRGPIACAAAGGHVNMAHFPLNRNMDSGVGYGAALNDANFRLVLDEGKPYAILPSHDARTVITLRDKNDNTIDPKNVPNELIYYQILAGQFQGTLKAAKPGQIVRYSLRDFKAADLDELADIIGEYGKHPEIWNATEGEIAAVEYAKKKVRVLGVKAKDSNVLELTLGIDRDVFPKMMFGTLPIELPKGFPVKSARIAGVDCPVTVGKASTVVDVPLQAALRDGCEMALKTAAPDMTIPDEMGVTLTIRNTSDKPIEDARLAWVGLGGIDGGEGLTVSGGTDSAFRIEPKSEKQIEAKARTARGSHFGLSAVQAIVTGKVAGEERVFLEGFEIVVAPRLRVDMDPMSRVPMPPGRTLYFEVRIANDKSSKPGGPPDRFISHRAGPCKGTISIDMPDGIESEPKEMPFELAENDRKVYLFKVRNTKWRNLPKAAEGEDPKKVPALPLEFVRPLVKFAGEAATLEVACPGTSLCRDQEIIDYKPLDDKGLLVYSSWDDQAGGGKFDRSVGLAGPHYYPGHSPGYSNEGVKSWCLESARSCQIYDSFHNIDAYEGTVMFWMRRDPKVRNELQVKGNKEVSWNKSTSRSNDGETIFTVGNVQRRGLSDGGMALRRYPGWDGKDGYLELVYQCLGQRRYYLQTDYDSKKIFDWRHVALVWSTKDRRLELYLDGELQGKAPQGETEWYPVPWDNGHKYNSWNMQLITTDHGNWCGTCRDEYYIYNRAFSIDEIKANMELAKKK